MNQARSDHKPMILIGVILVAVLLLIAYFFLTADTDPASGDKAAPAQNKIVPDKTLSLSQTSGPQKTDSARVVKKPVTRHRVFEYDNLNGDTESGRVMRQRLREMGIKKSLDMIVRSDESIKIDDRTLSMKDILEKASAEKQIIHESRITEFEATELEELHNYGIYVVQPGDNIWNIHFNILKEYYASRGIHVAYDADEPLNTGNASGVGKILKFSEIMVTIYNIIEEKIVTEIDLIEPLSKLVIYNLDDVFELLSDIDLEQVDQIRFDGSTLWIPAQET
jgi:hypothetical protein